MSRPQAKTNVCWISSARYSSPLDAVSARKWQLLAGLRGCEIRVIGFSTSPRPRRFTESVEFYLLPKPPTSLLRYLTIFGFGPPLLLYLVLRHKCEIIVAQSPFEGAIGAWVKRLLGVAGRRTRLIVENHNNFEEDVFLQRRIPLRRLYRALMLRAARFAFRAADATRVISSSTAERARHYAPHAPQARFMTFSDTDVFRRTKRSVPVEAASDIVYAGVLIPRKGLHILLDAFAQLDQPGARLLLVGAPENAAYAAALRRQAKDLGIGDQVDFVGAATQAELAARLGAARALALPSLSEGLGRVVVEAMHMGMPVIGSRVGGIPDLIDHGVNGLLVQPGDVAALTAALRRIYDVDASAMGMTARAFAEAFFSPQSYADGYRQLFELALSPGAARTNDSFERAG